MYTRTNCKRQWPRTGFQTLIIISYTRARLPASQLAATLRSPFLLLLCARDLQLLTDPQIEQDGFSSTGNRHHLHLPVESFDSLSPPAGALGDPDSAEDVNGFTRDVFEYEPRMRFEQGRTPTCLLVVFFL